MPGSTQTLARNDFWLFDRAFQRGVHAASEALFPENSDGIPDFRDTDLVARTESYVRRLPPSQRYLVALMFIAAELFTPILMLGWGPMSRRSPERRRADIQWMRKALFPLCLFGDALKAALSMIYLSHPLVVAHTGEFKVRENPGDEFVVEIREVLAADA